jgi:hypothetical protein
LNLRNNGSKLLFCNFFRYLSHFCLVLFGFAAVSILRSSAAQIALYCRLHLRVTGSVFCHLLFLLLVAGGFRYWLKSTFQETPIPDHIVPRIPFL